MYRYTIKYQYGSYSGKAIVWADGEQEAIARMWDDFRRGGLLTLPMATMSAEVVSEDRGAMVKMFHILHGEQP